MDPDEDVLEDKYLFTKEDFDNVSKFDLSLDDTDRSLDPQKIEEYLNMLPEKSRVLVKNVLNDTMYINYQTLLNNLRLSFSKFPINNNKKYYLFIPAHKIGSEHWLVATLWNELKQYNIKIIHNEIEFPKDPRVNIIYIDDCILSGENVFMNIDFYLELNSNGHRPTNTIENLMNSINLHLIIPFVSDIGKEYLRSRFKSMNIYFYNTTEIKGVNISGFEELGKKCLIYFDHKIPHKVSSVPQIYMGIYKINYGTLLKELPSRKPIDAIKEYMDTKI